ncbi:hypothetical protein DVH24_037920 [Malus domestica]|uniref:Uncharacterized protein n=1 Tax=Malus domestica TaxID=3750 RepID=A0A498K4Y3_MALDO|nr:hypothetical protein DVH24_037920 [Malus domestica]
MREYLGTQAFHQVMRPQYTWEVRLEKKMDGYSQEISHSDEEPEDGANADEQTEQGNNGPGDDEDEGEMHHDASKSSASDEDVL